MNPAPCRVIVKTPMPALNDRQVWVLSLAGAAAMFLVQPPADCWMLAWLAPLPWLAIVQADRLAAATPWRSLWVGGFCHWLAAIHWLRLPHPATSIGWVALAAYLACYVPLFVVIARRLVHGWRWPLVVAAPLAWMACEQLRGWVLGGRLLAGDADGPALLCPALGSAALPLASLSHSLPPQIPH